MGDYCFVVAILGVHASQACPAAFFMRIFVLDLSGNLGGAKSRFKASLRVGVAPLIITVVWGDGIPTYGP